MGIKYTNEKCVQIVIALLKERNIKKIIASPGTTNMTFVVSCQQDPFFEIYSCVDERSAAYMACGLATETNEAIVLSCTGATASRNYYPGLTEAFYRKLPILAITSSQRSTRLEHLSPQLTNRNSPPVDVVKVSYELPIIFDDETFWDCEIKTNKALNELFKDGGGPVHINIQSEYSKDYTTEVLPKVRNIQLLTYSDVFPKIEKKKVLIFLGSHKTFSQEETLAIETFCEIYNSAVICDHTSGYYGKYRVQYSIVAGQTNLMRFHPDICIHLGNISGDYYSMGINGNEIWRVNQDGKIEDLFRKLKYVFYMDEITFFKRMNEKLSHQKTTLYEELSKDVSITRNAIPTLPLSNIWIASVLAPKLPSSSTVYFAILNSLRAWNFFELPEGVKSFSNVGGFGIDGGISSLIGASLANNKKLYFCITGDLAFFYDMNCLGNRHIGKNLRIIIINNGVGTEFKNFTHDAYQLGDQADSFVAARGHFGCQSRTLIKNYSESLGFKYFSANTKSEVEKALPLLIDLSVNSSVVLEVFTNSEDESEALRKVLSIREDAKGKMKNLAKKMIGDENLKVLKKMINR